jgi:hypothetical protein
LLQANKGMPLTDMMTRTDSNMDTPLHLAAEKNHHLLGKKLIDLLEKENANQPDIMLKLLEMDNEQGLTPENVAKAYNNLEFAHFLEFVRHSYLHKKMDKLKPPIRTFGISTVHLLYLLPFGFWIAFLLTFSFSIYLGSVFLGCVGIGLKMLAYKRNNVFLSGKWMNPIPKGAAVAVVSISGAIFWWRVFPRILNRKLKYYTCFNVLTIARHLL